MSPNPKTKKVPVHMVAQFPMRYTVKGWSAELKNCRGKEGNDGASTYEFLHHISLQEFQGFNDQIGSKYRPSRPMK